jgi:hypothetical protein
LLGHLFTLSLFPARLIRGTQLPGPFAEFVAHEQLLFTQAVASGDLRFDVTPASMTM